MTSDPNTTNSFVVTAFFFEATLGVVALAGGWIVGVDPLATIPITAGSLGDHILAMTWGIAATVPLLAGLCLIHRVQIRAVTRIRHLVDERIVPLFQPLSLFDLAAVSFAAGFGEEVLFRGLLQTGIAQWWGDANGIVVGVVMASVLFGLCHWITPTYAAIATFAGAYFGLLFLLTGNLLTPLVAHALYDFLALVYLIRRTDRDET